MFSWRSLYQVLSVIMVTLLPCFFSSSHRADLNDASLASYGFGRLSWPMDASAGVPTQIEQAVNSPTSAAHAIISDQLLDDSVLSKTRNFWKPARPRCGLRWVDVRNESLRPVRATRVPALGTRHCYCTSFSNIFRHTTEIYYGITARHKNRGSSAGHERKAGVARFRHTQAQAWRTGSENFRGDRLDERFNRSSPPGWRSAKGNSLERQFRIEGGQ